MTRATLTDAQASALLWAICDGPPSDAVPREFRETLLAITGSGSSTRALTAAWSTLVQAARRHATRSRR